MRKGVTLWVSIGGNEMMEKHTDRLGLHCTPCIGRLDDVDPTAMYTYDHEVQVIMVL